MRRKRFGLLLGMMTACILLAGCGSGDAETTAANAPVTTGAAADAETESETAGAAESDTNAAAETGTAPELETIVVWSEKAHEQEIRERQIAEFNAGEGKELGIRIEYEVYGGGYADTIKIAAQAGEAPDLFSPGGFVMQDFVDSGFLVPIEELPGSEALLEKYTDLVSNQSNVFSGMTYSLPYNLTTYGFIINKDLFAEAGLTEADYPTTWEEVAAVGKKITDAMGGTAYGLGLSSTLWTISSFYTLPAGQSIGHYGYDWSTKQFDYSAYNPMIQAIDQMVADGSVFPGFETLDGDGVRAQFAAGHIAMIGAASFDCAVYTDQFPAACDWEVLDVPKFTADQAEYKRFGSPASLLCVGQKAKEHPEKVLKVLEFFYDDKNIAEMYEAGLYIPVRSEAVQLAAAEPDLKGWASFADFDEVFALPPIPEGLITIEGTAYREAIANMWATPALDDVETVMADVDKRYNEALAKADPETLALYILKDGETAEKSN